MNRIRRPQSTDSIRYIQESPRFSPKPKYRTPQIKVYQQSPSSALFRDEEYFSDNKRSHSQIETGSSKVVTGYQCFLMIFNILVTFWVAYVIWSDFNARHNSLVTEAILQSKRWEENFYANRCDSPNRPPAAASYCLEQQVCMNQNPYDVVYGTHAMSLIFAHTLNSFCSALEWRTVGVLWVLICTWVLSSLAMKTKNAKNK